MKFFTNSHEDTIRLGRKLGTFLSNGDVIALIGDLGSGKTCFTKGLALGVGVGPDTVITSPSFAIVNEYQGDRPFYHLDLYRLEGPSDMISVGLEEYLYSEGVAVVEWADRCPDILPLWSIEVLFEIVDERRRRLTFYSRHPRADHILTKLRVEQDPS